MADATDDPPVDLRRIQNIAEGDRAFEKEVLDAYLGDCAKRIARLRESIPAKDSTTARRDAHTIKGASMNIGTTRLHECARELEKTDPAQDQSEAMKQLEAVEAEFAAVEAYLQQYLAG